MTPEECIQASGALSLLSEQHFRAGNDMAGAEMLWDALSQVIIAIAMKRQQPFREHQHRRYIIRTLAGELDDQSIRRAFGKAQRLHVHFYLRNLDNADFAAAVAATHALIDRLLSLST